MYEKQKLNEAKYFYSQMTNTFNDRETFTYNLSAFLSAARSVLQYACEEAKNKRKQSWYDNLISKSDIFAFFKDKRDVNIHFVPIQPIKNTSVTITANIGLSSSVTVIHRDASGNIKYQSPPEAPTSKNKPVPKQAPEIKERYLFSDWAGSEDIMELCKKYIDELEAFVKDGMAQKILTP